jgi:hypothetical protein
VGRGRSIEEDRGRAEGSGKRRVAGQLRGIVPRDEFMLNRFIFELVELRAIAFYTNREKKKYRKKE